MATNIRGKVSGLVYCLIMDTEEPSLGTLRPHKSFCDGDGSLALMFQICKFIVKSGCNDDLWIKPKLIHRFSIVLQSYKK